LHFRLVLQPLVATVLALVPCMVVRAIGNRIVTLVRQGRLRHLKARDALSAARVDHEKRPKQA
jgi:hypothetical protein